MLSNFVKSIELESVKISSFGDNGVKYGKNDLMKTLKKLMKMSADQERLFKNRIDLIPEIKMDIEIIADFVDNYSKEEKVDFEEVVGYFYALEKKDKDAILERIKTRL